VLWVRPGTAAGTFGAAIRVSSGWGGFKVVLGFSDLTGDGHPDLVAQSKLGALYLSPGDGNNGLGARVKIGSASQWKGYNYLTNISDFLIARSSSGKTYTFNHDTEVHFYNRRYLTSKWSSATQIIGVGSFNDDTFYDYVVRTTSGSIQLWRGNEDGGFYAPVTLATNWSGRLLI
jgi:hypothetical protein